MNKKLNKERQDETAADSDMQPIVTTSASIAAMPCCVPFADGLTLVCPP